LAGRVADDDKERVRQATDIVDLVSQYVSLKQTGKNFKGLCPFHEDKNPSFVVSPDRQTYYCFACHAGGDAFAFVMAQERLDFPGALEHLARRAGVSLARRKPRDEAAAPYDRDRLYEANAWAVEHFASLLRSPKGRAASQYLEQRGFSDETIQGWHLGYAADAWDNLLKEGQRAGFKLLELELAGLTVARDSGDGYYDRFRNRLMFPIFDTQNRPIAFGARALNDEDQPKYLNSPETPLFSKGRALYGLNKAKRAITERDDVAVVEGYTDVLMAHQCGVPTVVATLGTALTRDHARLLRRFTPHVTVVFDADAAGQKASDRSLDLFVEESVGVRVVELPRGEDPCDALLAHGADAFNRLLDGGEELFSYKVALARRTSGSSPAERASGIDRVLETVARVPNGVERAMVFDRVVKLIQERFDIGDESALRRRLKSQLNRLGRRPASGPGGEDQPHAVEQRLPLPALEREVISIGLARPDLLPAIEQTARPAECGDSRAARILAAMIELHREGQPVTEAQLASRLEDAELTRLTVQTVAEDGAKTNFDTRLGLCLGRWRQQQQRTAARALKEQLKAAAGDPDAERRLWQDYTQRLRSGGEGDDGSA